MMSKAQEKNKIDVLVIELDDEKVYKWFENNCNICPLSSDADGDNGACEAEHILYNALAFEANTGIIEVSKQVYDIVGMYIDLMNYKHPIAYIPMDCKGKEKAIFRLENEDLYNPNQLKLEL